MKNFRDLAIKYKILFGFFGILAFFLTLGAYFIYSTGAISKASRQVELRNFTGVELTTNLWMVISKLDDLTYKINTANLEKSALIKHHEEMKVYMQKFELLLSDFKELAKGEPVLFKKLLSAEEYFNKYRNLIAKEIEARIKGEPFLYCVEEMDILGRLEQMTEELHDEDISKLSLALGQIDHLASDTRNNYFWLLLFLFIISVVAACGIAKIIVGPVKDLMVGMRKLANGTLDYQIEVKNKDEIGVLQSGFMNMAGRLRQAYAELRKERDGLDIKVKERTKDLEENQGYLKENIAMLEKIREELEKKVEELEKFSKLAVDRELRMIELKQKIKELEGKQNA